MNIIKLVTALLLACLFPIVAQAAHIDYIIDTDIGGDIDDVLALIVAMNDASKPLAVTTTHIEPVEKAKIAKLMMTEMGHPEIPVYAGIGTTRTDQRQAFTLEHPLWPPQFGYPNAMPGEKEWFPQQSQPYRVIYGVLFDNMKVEAEPAPQFIARIAKEYSPQHKLIIVALGPLHNIAKALELDPAIRNNIKIFAMGGVYPKGYNWLVSPEVTAPVLAQVETVTVISNLLDQNQLYFTAQEFSELEKSADTSLGHAIIKDWKNWYEVEGEMTQRTHLSDPVTLYLALHPETIAVLQAKDIQFPCLDQNGKLRQEFAGLWYNKAGLENKIIMVRNTEKHNRAQFVTQLHSPSKIRMQLLKRIARSMAVNSSSH